MNSSLEVHFDYPMALVGTFMDHLLGLNRDFVSKVMLFVGVNHVRDQGTLVRQENAGKVDGISMPPF